MHLLGVFNDWSKGRFSEQVNDKRAHKRPQQILAKIEALQLDGIWMLFNIKGYVNLKSRTDENGMVNLPAYESSRSISFKRFRSEALMPPYLDFQL